MVNRQKRKGNDWERQLVDILDANLDGIEDGKGKAKRVPGSGAIGTLLGESRLTGDVVAKINGLPKELRIECKTGYGGAKQLTVEKKWLDKIGEEANNTFSVPLLAAKFSGAKSGVRHFVVMDLNVFIELMNLITELGGDDE